MAVVIVCTNRGCDYTCRYLDSSESELVAAYKRVGGYNCPSCKAVTIKLKSTKAKTPSP